MDKGISEQIRQRYAQAIKSKSGCGGSTGFCGDSQDATSAMTSNLYQVTEMEDLPQNLLATSMGCGNPTSLCNLYAGETVLDLGSGAGLDVLLSANRVGPSGKAYGLDMTDEMLVEANANKIKSGINNAEFLKGHIEDIPLLEGSVDVVISNCVINLSTNKEQVFREIYRVLKPGGRIGIADILTTRPVPEGVWKRLGDWAGSISALTQHEYISKLAQVGFEDVEIIITRVLDLNNPNTCSSVSDGTTAENEQLNGTLVSAFIRAKKK